MITRNTYDKQISILQNVARHYSDNPAVQSIPQEVAWQRDNFDIKTIFVGHFNAGKSSLINALLGREDFLAEAQVPQTAICAELKFGNNERTIALTLDGQQETVLHGKEYSPTEYRGLHYTLPSEALQRIDGYTLVDTPGFDSFIESHELALSHYLSNGSIYFFVIDIEKGSIDTTTLHKITSIYRRCPNIAVLFNKCDKVTEDTIEQVIHHAKSLLESYGIRCPITGISKHDPQISKKLCEMITSFNAQAIFDHHLNQTICNAAQKLYMLLSTIHDNISQDTFTFDERLHSLGRKKETLLNTLEEKGKALKKEAPRKTSDVLDDVRTSLHGCSHQVASCLLMGSSQGAQSIVAEAVRSSLSESMSELSDRFYVDISGSLDFTGVGVSEASEESWGSILKSAGQKFSQMSGISGLEIPSIQDQVLKKDGKIDSKSGTLYKALTGGVALIATANPVVEAVIIFLPELIQLTKKLFGQSEISRIEQQYTDAIIPQVISTIAHHVETAVHNAMDFMLEQTKTWINESIQSLNQEISTAAAMKEKSQQDFQRYVDTVSEDCRSMETLAAETL